MLRLRLHCFDNLLFPIYTPIFPILPNIADELIKGPRYSASPQFW